MWIISIFNNPKTRLKYYPKKKGNTPLVGREVGRDVDAKEKRD